MGFVHEFPTPAGGTYGDPALYLGDTCNTQGQIVMLHNELNYPVSVVMTSLDMSGRSPLTQDKKTLKRDERWEYRCNRDQFGAAVQCILNWAYFDVGYFPNDIGNPYDVLMILFNKKTGIRNLINPSIRSVSVEIKSKNGYVRNAIIGKNATDGFITLMADGSTVGSAQWFG